MGQMFCQLRAGTGGKNKGVIETSMLIGVEQLVEHRQGEKIRKS